MNTNRTKVVELRSRRHAATVAVGAAKLVQLRSLLRELSGEDLKLAEALIDAATIGMTLTFDPGNCELRQQASQLWSDIHSLVTHHLGNEDQVVLPWAESQPSFPHEMVRRARRQHRQLRGLAKVVDSVSFKDDSDEVVARAAKALYSFAARLDNLIAGEERDLFPMLRHSLLTPGQSDES